MATQDICAINIADHLSLGTSDPVGYALAINAIDHPGRPSRPASTAVSAPSSCTLASTRSRSQSSSPQEPFLAAVYVTYPRTLAEPPLMPYVYRCAKCEAGDATA